MRSSAWSGKDVDPSVDFAKAFDNIPTTIALVFYAGPKSSESSYDFDTVLKRRFKVKSYLGEPLRATNGIMQGETLSCMVLHGLVSVLSNYLDKNAGKLENQ